MPVLIVPYNTPTYQQVLCVSNCFCLIGVGKTLNREPLIPSYAVKVRKKTHIPHSQVLHDNHLISQQFTVRNDVKNLRSTVWNKFSDK